MSDEALNGKYEVLKSELRTHRKLAIAFSGGVDSTFLLYATHEALGDNVAAVTAVSALSPAREMDETRAFCNKHGIRHIEVTYDPLADGEFVSNPANRCYVCKKRLFAAMVKTAEDNGIFKIAEGSNLDDEGDYRPGLKALDEMKILSPLREYGFRKKEIRELSRFFDLPTWDKPSYACLATRIPYGETIDAAKLNLIEKAENYLMELGFREVRVRVYGTINARIELNPNDFSRFMRGDVRLEVNQVLKKMGFGFVSLDLQGYRTGSLNEVLK
ncbi:MAG: ATP-dependent sacrificial sulfur transferase LarE [Eubacterium sp.]|nr:ATP-dependent sacrificial sulfur transferase LarE [Eubacterium sp.]